MSQSQQILGIHFFDGDVDGAVEHMVKNGGVLIAPSGTCFARLQHDADYSEAVSQADVAIPDSGAMVLLWKLFHRQSLTRISGWKYICRLSQQLFLDKQQKVLWIIPNDDARAKTTRWLTKNRFAFVDDDFYVAPFYDCSVHDRELLEMIEKQKPQHVVIGIGSGPQEKLGYYLRENLSYRPAIHCIGAALGFLTGDQVAIPDWADHLYLGWLLRLLSQPRIFLPRLWNGRKLPWLILRYGAELPPLRTEPR